MKKIPAYKIIWWSMPFIFLLFIFGFEHTIDIQMHDTYFVISAFHFAVFSTFIFAILGFISWLFRNFKLLYSLSLAHAVLSVFSFICLGLLMIYSFTDSGRSFSKLKALNNTSLFLLLLFLIMQIVFVFNIVIGLLKGKRTGD